jgi:hypothetical protein
MQLELLYAQENKFDARPVYTKTMLKPCTAKFHALFRLSTYTGRPKGSSKRRRGTVNISDIRPLKVNHPAMKMNYKSYVTRKVV